MKYASLVVFDIETGQKEFSVEYEYAGPVALAKKGRDVVDKAGKNANDLTDTATQYAKENRAKQLGYADTIDPFAKSTVPTTPGALSPYVKGQYDMQKRQIAKDYGDTAAVGLKSLQARGMGGAPSGLAASLYNTAGRNAGEAETNALADAQNRTLGAGLQGVGILQNQEQVFDPNKSVQTALEGTNAATNAGVARSKMGSTLGDIGAGIAGVGQIATGLPGAISGIKKVWHNG